MLEKDATVTTCHSKTRNLAEQCLGADIVITAVGDRARFTLTDAMIREGVVVIDIGTSRVNGKLAGDADYDSIIKKASYATPVPGGVGPMTRAMLLRNTVTAASISKGFVTNR
jgi:methylenetetrahydrofolate dehydrogenase (NADP+)/methenyltetrahydrofolate cyclohydrolase